MEVEHFSLITFTDTTKKACMCSALSIFLILLFVISPLSNFFISSLLMKLVTVLLLAYTIYLNHQQTNYLIHAKQMDSLTENVQSQLFINIVCSYVFTLFVGLLILFVLKSFF